MPYPDYQGHSILNLMATIRARFGQPSSVYAPLAGPAPNLADYEQVILLVVDGLGFHYLQNTANWMRQHVQARLTSVFPSTTATSITTFLTGQAPQQHGLTGWFTYFHELERVISVLPGMTRDGRQPLSELGIDIDELYRHPVVFDQLDVASYVVSPNWILQTDFNRSHTGGATPLGYETLDDMFEVLNILVTQDKAPKYVYAYWPEFDHLSHVHGNGSHETAQHFQQISHTIDQFMTKIHGSGALVLITADHGFIDVKPKDMITINDHPHLQACLRQPLCGEPRAAYSYVHDDKADTFVDYIGNEFSTQVTLVESQALLKQGVFGPGTPHPALKERIGDYTLVMQAGYIIKDWIDGETPFFHHGVHGGISDSEMYVPLVVLEA